MVGQILPYQWLNACLPWPSSFAIYSPYNQLLCAITRYRLSCKVYGTVVRSVNVISINASTTHVLYPQDRVRYRLIEGSLWREPSRCSLSLLISILQNLTAQHNLYNLKEDSQPSQLIFILCELCVCFYLFGLVYFDVVSGVVQEYAFTNSALLLKKLECSMTIQSPCFLLE